jgi:hypothetical protein
MKFLTKIFLIIGILLVCITLIKSVTFMRLKGTGDSNPALAPGSGSGAEPTLQERWKTLFGNGWERKDMGCEKRSDEDKSADEKRIAEEEAVRHGSSFMPKKKQNFYERRMIGWGPSAYLFDFLDGVLQEKITKEFDKIFTEAKAGNPSGADIDPYSLHKLLGMSPGTDQAVLIEKVKKLTENSGGKSAFRQDIWENSITVPQINLYMKNNKWFNDKNASDPGKALVDKFDFNGDGRLSRKEFIIAMIRVNKSLAGNGDCDNCMADVIKELIDPIFMYLDCSNEDKISAENIWTNIQKLQKTDGNKLLYRFFDCDLNGGQFRTATVNDFVMKSKKTMDGYLSKLEFRLGILQGYWTRQVDDLNFYKDGNINKLNMKTLRWNEDGKIDNICEALKGPKI